MAVLTLRKRRTIIFLASTGLFSVTIIYWNALGQAWTHWDERAIGYIARHLAPASLNTSMARSAHEFSGARARAFWSMNEVLSLLAMLTLALGFLAATKRSWLLYVAGGVMMCGLVALARLELSQNIFFPLASVLCGSGFIFGGLLASRRYMGAKDQARVRQIFATRLAPRSLRQLLAQPEHVKLEGEEREVTLLCVRLKSAATPASRLTAQTRVKLLQEFYGEAAAILMNEGGLIDRRHGDSMTAIFGAPLPAANHAEPAVRAALMVQRRLLELYKQWERVGLPRQRCCFGIHTGNAVLGNLRAREDCDYAAFGESVDFAVRLCESNDEFATALLISESTFAALTSEAYRTRCLETGEAIKIYEVYGDLATYRSPIDASYYQSYEKAFAAYHAQDFASARDHIAAALHLLPNDPAALALRARISSQSAK